MTRVVSCDCRYVLLKLMETEKDYITSCDCRVVSCDCRYVLLELMETEKDYVRDLGLLVEVSTANQFARLI